MGRIKVYMVGYWNGGNAWWDLGAWHVHGGSGLYQLFG